MHPNNAAEFANNAFQILTIAFFGLYTLAAVTQFAVGYIAY